MAYKLPTRPGTWKKYKKIQERHKFLYNEQRLRIDDCNAQVMGEFFIDHEVTLMRILNTTLPEEAPKKIVNPNQIDIFGQLEGGGSTLLKT